VVFFLLFFQGLLFFVSRQSFVLLFSFRFIIIMITIISSRNHIKEKKVFLSNFSALQICFEIFFALHVFFFKFHSNFFNARDNCFFVCLFTFFVIYSCRDREIVSRLCVNEVS